MSELGTPTFPNKPSKKKDGMVWFTQEGDRDAGGGGGRGEVWCGVVWWWDRAVIPSRV